MTVRRWLRRHVWLSLWLPVLLWMGIIFVLSAQPDFPHPSSGWLDLVVSSLAHVFLFGVLAALLVRALANGRRALLLSLILTMLYALTDELHQGFVPGRHPDLLDLLCDGIGGALALGVWIRVRRKRAI